VLETTTILATGIFLGGQPSLVIGLPYGIGMRGDRVVVTGPLTTEPGQVVAEWPRESSEVTITGNQALLTAGARRRGHPEVGVIFGSLAVGRDVDLETRISGATGSGQVPDGSVPTPTPTPDDAR
jgi:hypothetical protein